MCPQVLGLSLLPLDFSLILSVVSRLLPPHSTDNKTSRLMVKGFSTVRDTQRFTVLHQEEESEEGDRREQKEKKGGFKKGETDLVCTLFPKCSLQPRTPTEIHRIGLRREGGGRK